MQKMNRPEKERDGTQPIQGQCRSQRSWSRAGDARRAPPPRAWDKARAQVFRPASMSPCKSPVKNIKLHVPRHNSQRIGPLLTTHVESLARKQKKRVDVRQTAYDPASILAQAIVSNVMFICTNTTHIDACIFLRQDSASEWNSLLMTARAERGPQWDIGTQQ